MHQPPANHVSFVYVGQLQSRGRLLKQIATLQKAGVTCDVVLGNTSSEEPDPGKFGFAIASLPVCEHTGRLTSFISQLGFCRKASRRIAEGKADTVVCLALESLLAGVWAKRLRPSLRLIFDNNELHIESFESRIKRMVWKPIHNYAVRHCDVILHAQKNRMEYFKQNYPGRDKPQQVIENFPFVITKEPRPKDFTGELNVIYLGGFGTGRYTFEILQAFTSQPANVKLDIVGYGSPGYLARIESYISKPGCSGIRILPPVPYLEIADLLERYHIGLAFYKNTNLNNYYCAPNKVYDYLMNGMPVITNDYPGLVSVVEQNQVGVCIENVNAATIGAAIERIVAARLWENITPELKKRYSWETQETGYLAVFGR